MEILEVLDSLMAEIESRRKTSPEGDLEKLAYNAAIDETLSTIRVLQLKLENDDRENIQT